MLNCPLEKNKNSLMQVWRNRYDEEKRKSPSLLVFRQWVSTTIMEAMCSCCKHITQRVEDLAAGLDEKAYPLLDVWFSLQNPERQSINQPLIVELMQKLMWGCGNSIVRMLR